MNCLDVGYFNQLNCRGRTAAFSSLALSFYLLTEVSNRVKIHLLEMLKQSDIGCFCNILEHSALFLAGLLCVAGLSKAVYSLFVLF